MALSVAQMRGILLEELVADLLVKVGYRRLDVRDEGVTRRQSGLYLRGRGSWHQIDCIGLFRPTPPFLYPIRLLIEAKCYSPSRPVNLTVPRNALGVLRDIDENFVTVQPRGASVQAPRFNHRMAVFSTSGYTRGAQWYALAHQIFLITYEHVPLMIDVANGLLDLRRHHFRRDRTPTTVELQDTMRELLHPKEGVAREDGLASRALSEEGLEHFDMRVVSPFQRIAGSYFGMLQGRYPMHLVADRPISPRLVASRDTIRCRIRRNAEGVWQFESGDDEELSLRLEFDLPKDIARLASGMDDPRELAELKKREFSFIELTGVIGGVRRFITLELDFGWLRKVLEAVD